MTAVTHEVKLALRLLRRQPGFSLLAVFTLALGIAASTSIFSVVKGALLTPWPYRGSDRIVTLKASFPKLGRQDLPVLSAPEIEDLRRESGVFEHVLAGVARNVNLIAPNGPERIRGAAMTASSFEMLGVRPLMGRTFVASDDVPGAAPVVVLSYRFWKNRMGGDPGVIGRALNLEGTSFTIVGVMPTRFVWWDREIWTPLQLDPGRAPRTRRELYAQASLRQGASIPQAEAALRVFARRLQAEHPEVPEYEGWSIRLRPLEEEVLRDLRPALYILFGAVLLLLSIGCANVANMMLVQASARESEMAIRAALGAQARDIGRQLAIESLILSGLGGAAGFAASVWGVKLIASLVPYGYIPAEADVRVDSGVAAFSVIVSAGAGLIASLVPAAQASRADLFHVLRQGAASAGTPESRRLRSAFLVGQVALAAVVLGAAGLLLNSFHRITTARRGFNAENVAIVRLPLSADRYRRESQVEAVYQELLRRAAALPRVRVASLGTSFPAGEGRSEVFESADGAAAGGALDADFDAVSPRFFEGLEIPLVAGRPFTDQDRAGSPLVAMVNQSLARRLWPGKSAIGQQLSQAGLPPAAGKRLVIGVVADVRRGNMIDPPRPAVYVPWTQVQPAPRVLTLALKTSASPGDVVPEVRREVAALDPELPVFLPQTLDEAVSDLNGPQRLATALLTAFAAIALLLCMIGLYATISHSVAQRRGEIGIRIALGATSGRVIRSVLVEGLRPLLAGLAIGTAVSLAAGRVLSGLLYGVSPTDPATLLAMAAVLSVAALLASYVPARRASRIDPMLALR